MKIPRETVSLRFSHLSLGSGVVGKLAVSSSVWRLHGRLPARDVLGDNLAGGVWWSALHEFLCFVGFDAGSIGAINAYRMDFTAEAWCRVHDIGDAVILLENTNMAASCPASPLGLKANQIYFMNNFVADDADLCIFDIEWEMKEITRVHQRDDLLHE